MIAPLGFLDLVWATFVWTLLCLQRLSDHLHAGLVLRLLISFLLSAGPVLVFFAGLTWMPRFITENAHSKTAGDATEDVAFLSVFVDLSGVALRATAPNESRLLAHPIAGGKVVVSEVASA